MLALTPAGNDLLTLALAGTAEIHFTHIQIGSGADAGSAATALSHVEMTLPIERITTGDIKVVLRSTFNNNDVVTGWRMTEVGVLARDPDDATAEILYAYEYTPPEHADYVPPNADRSLETMVRALVYVGDAANVTAEIASGIYATLEELAERYVTAGQKSGTSLGTKATAEGISTTASGKYSHAEGYVSTASAHSAHAEGNNTRASGIYSHAEGSLTQAGGDVSHAEGYGTVAASAYQHVFGRCNVPDSASTYVEIVGNGMNPLPQNVSNARTLDWYGNEVLAGKLTLGTDPTADMDAATKSYVDEHYVRAGRKSDTSIGSQATAEGTDTTASGNCSHAEGDNTVASGTGSHAEGGSTTGSGNYSHAEGFDSAASGQYSHAEGDGTQASDHAAHAEGIYTTASGDTSHAEGFSTTASGRDSHAEGFSTTASGRDSHAEGSGTTASRKSQHVFGEHNVADTSGADGTVRGDYIEIVGNGTSTSARSNARTLDWHGNEALAGGLTLGKGTADECTITAAQLSALLALLTE